MQNTGRYSVHFCSVLRVLVVVPHRGKVSMTYERNTAWYVGVVSYISYLS